MQDISAFPTPDEYPQITNLVKACEMVATVANLDEESLHHLASMLVEFATVVAESTNAKVDDIVYHIVRNEHGTVTGTIAMDNETYIAFLTMEAMDNDDGESESPD